MRNNLVTMLCLALWASCSQPEVKQELSLMPKPQEVLVSSSFFPVKHGFRMENSSPELKPTVEYLQALLTEWNDKVEAGEKSLPIELRIAQVKEGNPEAYHLTIEKSKITIEGNSAAACFYGIQSLKQLVKKEQGKLLVQRAEIIDYPNFRWRSYLLDEARHFFGKEFVKKQIDELAALKINKFQWHLTDDAGWRIEIKKYPKLTEVGAYRNNTEIETWGSGKLSGKAHGGFYTQEDIKEVIAYAQARHIQIVPEIEMPGHASAAIAAYPWLGIIGKLTEVPYHFGKLEDSYNIANPKVVRFLKDVLDEVCELFPSEVIHIGGDEVLFGTWSKSEEMQRYMKENGLNSPADAQIKFTNDISNYLESKGKRMMGWNEIMGKNVHQFDNTEDYKDVSTALSKKTIVHFWRGEVDMITEAARGGYQIVNSLHTDTYLDYSYDDSPLKHMYAFSPIPPGLEEKYEQNIIGVGAQMWNEWNEVYPKVEHKTFPRIAAIAEVAWSGAGDYANFIYRLKAYSENWTKRGVNFPAEEIK